MKRSLLPLLLAALLLTGCSSMYPEEFISVEEHQAPYAYREVTTEPPPTETEPADPAIPVSRASDIREAIQELVMAGQESGLLRLEHYAGNVEVDMQDMFNTLLNDSPKYCYAMDSFDWSLSRQGPETFVQVEMKLRLTPQEVQAIETRLYPGPALNDIYAALRQQVSAFTVQISGYRETDFYALLDDYILRHPDQIVEAPGLLVSVYPDRGSVRVVELHFVYQTDRETLRRHKEDADTALELFYNQLSPLQSAEELLETLSKYLVPAFGYRSNPEATVYSQILQKSGSSRTMASVAAYLCNRVGDQCEIVEGEREGERWYWNRILSEDRWYSFDLHAAALTGETPSLRPADEMTGYTWDAERYPEIEVPEPATEAPEKTE